MTIRDIAISFGYQVDKASEKKVENSIQGIKSKASKILGAFGVAFSLVKINAIAEEFSAVNNQIINATKHLGEQREVQQAILQSANACRSAYAATADIVSNLVQENKDLFPSVEEAAQFAELTTKLFKTAGKSNEEIATLQEAINKSFAKGIVDSETISQLYERAPEAINLIADSLGVASSELTQMATDGKISLDTLKTAFTSNADLINANFESVALTVSDAILGIRNRWGLWVTDINKSIGITQTVAKTMVRVFNSIMEVLKKVQGIAEKVVKTFGGLENLIKLIAIAASAAGIVSIVTGIVTAIKNLDKALLAAKLKILAIIAVVVVIALLVEDFIAFMQGKDSVIGSLLEKAGVDTGAVRDKITAAWAAIKDFLSSTWDKIKEIAMSIWGGLKAFWEKNGAEIKARLSAAWESIKTMLAAYWEAISAVAAVVFEALKAFWDKWGEKIKTSFGVLWRGIGDLFMSILAIITDIFSIFAALFSGDWEGLWESVKSLFSNIWDGIVNVVSTVLDTLWAIFGETLTNIWNKVVEVFTNIKTSIVDTVTGIKDSIVSGFQAAIDWIKSLPAQALQWGRDIIQGIIDGIASMITAVVDTVKGVAQTISDFLGFSVPDKGPLTDFPNWMPDFMGGLAKGIKDNMPKVQAALEEVGFGMSLIAEAKLPGTSTTRNMVNNSSTRNVTMYANFESNFHGERAMQREAAKSMEKSTGDASAQLARALAYAR